MSFNFQFLWFRSMSHYVIFDKSTVYLKCMQSTIYKFRFINKLDGKQLRRWARPKKTPIWICLGEFSHLTPLHLARDAYFHSNSKFSIKKIKIAWFVGMAIYKLQLVQCLCNLLKLVCGRLFSNFNLIRFNYSVEIIRVAAKTWWRLELKKYSLASTASKFNEKPFFLKGLQDSWQHTQLVQEISKKWSYWRYTNLPIQTQM